MKAKKFLTVLSLSALLAGTGVTTLQNYQQASAATKKHKSTKKVKKAKKAKLNMDGTDKQSKYSSFGVWFQKNWNVISNYYNYNANDAFSSGSSNSEEYKLQPKMYNNPAYKYAWIHKVAMNKNLPSFTGQSDVAQYNKFYEVYKAAGNFIKSGNSNTDYIYLDTTTLKWSDTKNN